MINYSGTIEAKESKIVDTLPVGAYIGKILEATVETIQSSNGDFDRLLLKMDVAEGEYKDHFTKLFESQSGGRFPAKYKGTIRFNIPQVGSKFEQGQKKQLEHLAFCLQDSNPKYKWDGDETKLKGLKIGFSVRERDWLMEQDGMLNHGTTTEIGRVESAAKVAAGQVKPMKKKELCDADKARLAEFEREVEAATSGELTESGDSDLPF